MDALSSRTSFQRYVLFAVLAHESRGEVPVQSYDVRDFCAEHVDNLTEPTFEGGVSRESTLRALSVLENEGLLDSEVVDASPVGKGRPAYRLAVDLEATREALADDELLGDLIASLETES